MLSCLKLIVLWYRRPKIDNNYEENLSTETGNSLPLLSKPKS